MPQVAQQDYKCLKAHASINGDAAVLSALVKSIENHTIFDVILDLTTSGAGIVRVVSYFYDEGEGGVQFYDDTVGEINSVSLDYTATQYEGLAAIQEAENFFGSLPEITTINSQGVDYLLEGNEGVYVCIDGYSLIVTTDENGKIGALNISEIAITDEHINITWEDAQKLIGLPIVQ